jgi:hypothetical protein
MRLPDSFVADLKTLIAPLCKMTGYIGKTELDAIIGKAARVAFVVPMAKPFVAGLWGGLYAAIKESNLGVYSAPPGCVPCRRLCYAASWVWALLSDEESCPLRLERLVGPGVPIAASPGGWTIEFDASIYGGGGVLRNPDREVVEYFSIVWNGEEAKHLHVVPGDSRHQTFWEYATLLLCLMTWGDNFVKESVLVVGDNTGSLSNALSLKGKGDLLAISRELSWRQARRHWLFSVGHLPSEHNVVADALSRRTDPKGVAWPSLALRSADFRSPPNLRDVWLSRPR